MKPELAAEPKPLKTPAKNKGKKVYAATKKIETVTENLALRVKDQEWKGGERLPSQSQLAREYHVSQGAIAIAMRTLQKNGLLQLIPGRGAFIPERDAITTKSVLPTIGIRGSYINPYSTSFLNIPGDDPQPISSYSYSLLLAIWTAAQRQERPLLLLPDSNRLTRQSCHALGVHGVLFLGGESIDEALELRLTGFPVITANPPSKPTAINYANHDHGECLVRGLRQLLDAGHSRIAVLFPTTTTPGSFQQFKPLYIETLCAAGHIYNFENYWRVIAYPNDTHKVAFQTVDELLSLPEPPTAIFCLASTSYLQAVHEAIQKHRLSVPRDISLMCAPLTSISGRKISGFALQIERLAETLLNGLHETIKNPFYSLQAFVPYQSFADHGTVAPPPPPQSPQR